MAGVFWLEFLTETFILLKLMFICDLASIIQMKHLASMLRTDLKPSARFKTVWTVLKPSGPF